MVERYLFVKLSPEHSSEAGRRRAAQEALLLASGTGLAGLRVGLPADAAAVAAWDLSVALRFESLDAAERFIAGPAYDAFTDAFLGEHGRVVKAWTFEIQTGA
jgi:hypothetical protein